MGGTPTIVTLGPGIQFEPGAAASFSRLVKRLGRVPDVNRTYADYGTQLRMYNAWQAWVTGRGPKPNHSRALHPDESMHCRGLAWDSDDWATPGFTGLAAEYGFIRTAASDPTELHHFEYQWWRDEHRNDPTTAGGLAPDTDTIQEEDMPNGYYAKGDKSAEVYWIDQTTGKRRKVPKGELTAAQAFNVATGGKFGAGYTAVMPQAEFDAIPKA